MEKTSLLDVGILPKWFTYRNVRGRIPNLSKTLLGLFVMQKSMEYVEPQRTGTARGEPIGFPQNKFDAALWVAVYSHKQKQLAMILGISHGLLRKWNTEDEFKKLVDKHRREFAVLAVDWIFNVRPKEEEKLYDGLVKQGPSVLEFENSPFLTWHEFSDYDSYNKDLQAMIEVTLIHFGKDNPDDYSIRNQLLGFINYVSPYPDSPRLKLVKIKARNNYKKVLFGDIRDKLSKPHLTRKDRMYILLLVQQLCQPEPEPIEQGDEDVP